ncbi:MAG: helix-turn-helix domain-containing protein [Proteobacteria bacterium]|nr:helix-turn-helix domain-containing protein [Pseudomonadota bacterium]
MSVQKNRLERGWSQEHLAQMSGLSLRTIQRIESGRKAGLDSLNALAAAFGTDLATLRQESIMTDPSPQKATNIQDRSDEEKEARDYVRNIRGLKMNIICAIFFLPLLYLLDVYISPGHLWVQYAAAAWLVAILFQVLAIYMTFRLFGIQWEQRAIKKRLDSRRQS